MGDAGVPLMKALCVSEWGEPAAVQDVPRPALPTAESGEVQLKVIASGLHNLVRAQTAGNHFTVKNASLPYIPGADGVGVTPEGSVVYFNSMNSGGGFGQWINVPRKATFKIPVSPSLSPEEKQQVGVYVAALFNPAMSSWMAMRCRTKNLPPNFTVLILGATSLSGQIAASLARANGAGKVIGVARSKAAMEKLNLDQTIELTTPPENTDFKGALEGQHVHVILDYLYGPAALHLLESLPSDPLNAHNLETQYVNIGMLGGNEISFPAHLLRSEALTMRGSGPGAWSVTKDITEHYPELLEKLVNGVGDYPYIPRKLEDVNPAYEDKRGRSVFIM